MWKSILKAFLKMFAEPIFDAIVEGFENIAKRTETEIDDNFIKKLKEYKNEILGFLLSQSENIAKRK